MRYFYSLASLSSWIYSQVCCHDYRIFKLFLFNLNKKENSLRQKYNYFYIFKDRLKTFIRVLKMPLYIKFEKNNIKNIVFSTSGFSDKIIIKEHIHTYDRNEKLFFMSNSILEPIYIYSVLDMLRFIKYYLLALKDVILLIIIFNKVPTKELSFFLYSKVKLLLYKPKKLYLYSSQDLNSNLLALYSTNCMKIQTDIIIGFLGIKQRYGYYNNIIRLVFISRVVLEQYLSFKKIGWIKSYNTELLIAAKPEHVRESVVDTIHDIGFFSTGMWARSSAGRSYNKEEVLRNKKMYSTRKNAKVEMIILNNLILLAKKYSFTLKIYLHPYEKELIEKFNIYPPYLGYNNDENIIIDKNVSNSSNIYEANIGVVMVSTIFYDRWENDLYTLCFEPKNKKYFIHMPLKYLGIYSKYGFKNIKELEQKILKQLKVEKK